MSIFKRLLSILGLIGLLPYLGFSQSCSSNDLIIFSQQSILEYKLAYPDCDTIHGNLIIDDSSDVSNGNYSVDIIDLSALSNISIIEGSLVVRKCPLLPSLQGLSNVDSIGGDLYIYDNDHPDFTSFQGLESLHAIRKRITVRLMDNLETFEGMGTIVGPLLKEIKITDNPKLVSIAPLNGITSTGTDVTIKRNQLTSLEGLNSMKTIGGFLNVRAEPSITDISQLASLVGVGTEGYGKVLNISNNPLLTSLNGLQNVQSISGQLYVLGNDTLGNCDDICHILRESLAIEGAAFGSNLFGSPCFNNTSVTDICELMMPIALVEFSSRQKGEEVVLQWKTETELKNAGFYIERSENGRDWYSIGWVDGAGTTNDNQMYYFVDKLPVVDVNYYRLKQVDYDGTFEYTHVISELFLTKSIKPEIMIHPNPAQYKLFVTPIHADVTSALILNTHGKLMLSIADFSGGADLSSLPNGIYFVKLVINSEEIVQHKLIILR